MYVDSKGIIWAGTGSNKTALIRFDPSALHTDNDTPTLVIKSIKVNGVNVCWYDLENAKSGEQGADTSNNTHSTSPSPKPALGTVEGERAGVRLSAYITEEVTTIGKVLTEKERDSMKHKFGGVQFDSIRRFYPIPENLVLPYSHNDITIDFNAIETSKPTLVNYRYMLVGYDKDWSPLSKNTSATFGNIHEGTYTFRVKAQGPNGIWCEPVTYSFRVLPPWYRTWWAYLLYISCALSILYLIYRWRTAALRRRQKELEQTVTERTVELVAEKKKSDDLLLNILPEEIADELKAKGSAEAKMMDEVTVLFTDFKGFTQLTEKLSPRALVAEINDCFSAFDLIMEKHGIEKIKTIGDSYMAAGGLPTPNKTHATDVVKAALEIQEYMYQHKLRKESNGELFFEIRIGVHTGPVVAGIVGIKKFQYDIWGDTVNTASRMESSGGVGKVNTSQTTYEIVKDKFTCEYRGEIEAKGKGQLKMYFASSAVAFSA